MKRLSFLASIAAVSSSQAATVLIDNTAAATIASGDRANIRGFAFKPQAGGSGPASTLTQSIALNAITLHRPGFNDATTPQFGATAGLITSSTTPVFLKVYDAFTGGTNPADVGNLLGVSANGISWADVDAINGTGPSTATAAPFEGFTFSFPSITLDKDTTYWFVFSETSDSSVDVAQFRLIVEAGAGAAGSGYLAETAQVRTTTGAATDWGVYFVASTETIPEPTSTLTLSLAALGMAFRRRR